MLPLVGGNASRTALENGAYQRATITVYDAKTTGNPQIAQFTNANILAGSLLISKSGVTGDRLEFGSCMSDEMQFRVRTSSSPANLLGQKVTLAIEWDYDGPYSPEVIYPFVGIITNVRREQDDVFTVVALDSLIAFDKPYRQVEVFDHTTTMNLTFPVSVFDLVWDIATSVAYPYIAHTGITVPSDYTSTFANYAYTINGIPEDQGYTYRDILRWCAQIMGCNVGIDGGLQQLKLYLTKDTQVTYDTGHVFYSARFGERPSDDLYGKYLPRVDRNGKTVYPPTYLYDDDHRRIIVSDNMLIPSDANGSTIGGNLSTHYLSSSLIPDETRDFTGTAVSLWYLEPYDIVRFVGGEVVLVTSVRHKLNGSCTITAKTVPETAFYAPGKPFNTQQTAELNAQVTPIADAVGAAQDDITTLQGDMSTTQGNVSSLQGSVSSLQGSVSSLQGSVSSLIDDLYYKPGDTYHAKYYTVFPGFFTGSNGAKSFYFSVRTNKSLKNISTITVTTMTGRINTVEGYAVDGSGSNTNGDAKDWKNMSGITITPYKIDDYNVRINVANANYAFTSQNYTPAIFAAQGSTGLTLSFS